MWLNAGIFTGVFIIVFILLIFLKKLDKESKCKETPDLKKTCKFKITHPRYRKNGRKRIANFVVIIIGEYTAFFEDFPLTFRLYSDTRFRSKLRVSYSTKDSERPEIIINEVVVFENNEIEFICPITDIIPDEIHIEMEIDPEYGYPNAVFEIRKNPLCDLTTDLTRDIIFPR